MKNKKMLLTAFILVAIVQLYVPAKMILDKEKLMTSGTEYKFKTAPIDPTDPFRGKYITLHYDENMVEVQNEKDWVVGQKIYVLLTMDDNGFAKVTSVSDSQPTEDQEYIKAKVRYVTNDGAHKLTIEYPFDRYYMEESKAYNAEQAYLQSSQDTTQFTYALVNIKEGEAVLKDVMIDGVSIKTLVQGQ